jgi:hypothetical protein
MLKLSVIIFFLMLLVACSPARVVNFSALNTGIPVLLSPSDRIGSSANQKCSAGKITEKSKINVKMSNAEIFTTTGNFSNSRSVQAESSVVDVVLLNKTMGDKNTNICIDALETSDLGVYFVFGFVETTKVSMDAHVEKNEKGDNLNPKKAGE